MRALILAGGAGSRLNRGEKPLVTVGGQPMIRYVAEAFRKAGCEPVVVGSSKTPMTMNWCRAQGIPAIRAPGEGFIDDMIIAVTSLEETGPVLISVCDIPCITPEIIRQIIGSYESCEKEALSTWVPARLVTTCRGSMPYREVVGGTDACPCGVNILRGRNIEEEQDEFRLLLDEPRLALNINTPADLERAGLFLISP
ncbi:MAG: NTP transferase domain-containing protein [Methanomicrobiales archaeon]|nr:NTP transferase domain-containing protein [Methanomicrobiales archaeon]